MKNAYLSKNQIAVSHRSRTRTEFKKTNNFLANIPGSWYNHSERLWKMPRNNATEKALRDFGFKISKEVEK